MLVISDQAFQSLIDEALSELPGEHVKNISNIAIVYADLPTLAQRQQLRLRPNETLLGLYEGVPLTKRQGQTRLLPDKITLFKLPLMRGVQTPAELRQRIKHTLWHEIAHYYGLNHDHIRELE